MRERIKRAMGSLYWRQFMLGAGMVLLTMVLLGVSFYALSYNYHRVREAQARCATGPTSSPSCR